MSAKSSEEEFIRAWHESGGSPTGVARALRTTLQCVYRRRARLARQGIDLATTPRPASGNGSNGDGQHYWRGDTVNWPARREIVCKGGSILIGSDAHFWPDILTTAFKAFLKVAKKLEPQYIILNGDTLDGARISRHDPIAWEKRPTIMQELETVQERCAEIRKAAPNAVTLWTAGNHDTRYERYLAMRAPEMERVPGMMLMDHLGGWVMSWSIMVNAETYPVMIKHAFRGGIHAVRNNTLNAGISIVTGHLHSQLCTPVTDYRGTRYGVDAGTLADIDGPQFLYTLDNPVNWRSGFAVLNFDNEGRLMPPELCEVQTFRDTQRAIFRGAVILENMR